MTIVLVLNFDVVFAIKCKVFYVIVAVLLKECYWLLCVCVCMCMPTQNYFCMGKRNVVLSISVNITYEN